MYKCVCGREFTKELSLYAHQSHCREYLGEERYQARLNKARQSGQKGSNIRKQKLLQEKKIALDKWIEEKHTCEKCGKVMTEKYAGGRFCCRSCANGKEHTEEQKLRIKQSAIKASQRPDVIERRTRAMIKNMKVCEKCGKKVLLCNYKSHMARHKALVTIVTTGRQRVILDITNDELEQYRKDHPVCEICGKPETRKNTKRLTVDHDHETGHFRGLLCFKCNTNLGVYERDRELFEQYITRKK